MTVQSARSMLDPRSRNIELIPGFYDAAFTLFLSASTRGRYLSQSLFQPSAFFLARSIAVSENFTIGVRAGPGFTYPANSMGSLAVGPSLPPGRSPPAAPII